MLPPEWLPTSRTGPLSGMFSSPRTSARCQIDAKSQRVGSVSRMKSGSRSRRTAGSAVIRFGAQNLPFEVSGFMLAEGLKVASERLVGGVDLGLLEPPRVVDVDRLPLRELVERAGAGLTVAVAGVFDAAEGRLDLGADGRRVYVDDA